MKSKNLLLVKATLLSTSCLVAVYMGVSILAFGSSLTLATLLSYWYFMIILAASFGFQIAREVLPSL